MNLKPDDIIRDTTKVTTGFFTGDVGSLAGSNLATASLDADEKIYYYNLQNSSEDQFSVSYGHNAGSGSVSGSTANKFGQTQAIYDQFATMLLKPDDVNTGFVIANATASSCHFIVAERARMKDRVNRKNWTLQLSGSTSAGAATTLHLTDDSNVTASVSTIVGPRYNIKSGSSGTIVGSTVYGHFYPNMGVFVLSTSQLSSSLPGTIGYITSGSINDTVGVGFAPDDAVTADNAIKMVNSLQLGTHTLRSEEDQTEVMYFCRAKASEFNFSNNPTFTSGSDNGFRQKTMEGNPQTFISTVGLYNTSDELVAVGRLSTPVQKNHSTEAVIKVKLVY